MKFDNISWACFLNGMPTLKKMDDYSDNSTLFGSRKLFQQVIVKFQHYTEVASVWFNK